MKTRNLILMGLVLASMILTACQPKASNVPDDPVAAVKVIADKQKEITSEHIDVTLNLSIQGSGFKTDPNNPSSGMVAGFLKNFKANVAVGGDVDAVKNNISLTGTLDLGPLTSILAQGADQLTFDVVKVDDKMYTRSSVGNNTDWNESAVGGANPSSTASVTATQAMAQLSEILKKAAKAEKLADENIGGVNTYHYKVTLDANTLIDQIVAIEKADSSATPPDAAQIQQAKDLLKDSVFELEMWVGQDDLFIRQETLHINLNLKNIPDNPGATMLVDFLIKADLSKINQPVTIVAPK